MSVTTTTTNDGGIVNTKRQKQFARAIKTARTAMEKGFLFQDWGKVKEGSLTYCAQSGTETVSVAMQWDGADARYTLDGNLLLATLAGMGLGAVDTFTLQFPATRLRQGAIQHGEYCAALMPIREENAS